MMYVDFIFECMFGCYLCSIILIVYWRNCFYYCWIEGDGLVDFFKWSKLDIDFGWFVCWCFYFLCVDVLVFIVIELFRLEIIKDRLMVNGSFCCWKVGGGRKECDVIKIML